MSIERDGPVEAPEAGATGDYQLPAPGPPGAEPSSTQPEQTGSSPPISSTGEYVPAKLEGAREGQVHESSKAGEATLRPTAAPTPDSTGIYLPPGSRSQAAGSPSPGVKKGGIAPDLSGPALKTASAASAGGETGAYVPVSTQSPVQQGTVDRDPNATGEFVEPGATAPEGNALGATGDFDPARTVAPTDLHPSKVDESIHPESRCGRYILKRFHAKGGMGEIWFAEDPAIGRPVALKRMLGRREDRQRRFRVEAQVTGQLEHPGIVPVHELGTTEDGLPFYAMKFVRGHTLQKALQAFHNKKGLSSEREVEQLRLLQTFVSLCQTVAYAHSRGVLHRDLKPENVMLGPFGETLLLDWGIAKVMGQPEDRAASPGDASYVHLEETGRDTETQAGSIMGSPSYMAPEVAAGLNDEVDQRSDVYLLGATLYEILTGRLPREGKTAMDMIKQAQRQPPLPPRKVNPQVPRALEAICLKAMELRQQDRYQSALELAEEIQRYIAGEQVSAYPESLPARAWRWAKRHRKALVRGAGAVLFLGVLFVGIVLLREAEERRLAAQRETERLQELDQARLDVKKFRGLADEARFFAATTDPVAEHAPYFNPKEGAALAKAALALAKKWGPTVDDLPLREDADSVKQELYDLYLLSAQANGQLPNEPKAARETLTMLEKAGGVRPPSKSYYRFRARAYETLGDKEKASAARKKAVDPGTPATSLDHFLRGEQYRKESAGKPLEEGERKAWKLDPKGIDKAIEQYHLALAIDPEHYWSHYQLGRCYLSQGRIPEAVEALGACVALRPKAPWGYSARGFALAQQKHYVKAESDLNQAIQLKPDSRPARLNRGVVYWSQKKNSKALEDFKAVLQPPKEKRLVEAAYYRGQLYLQLGKIKDALEDFNRVIAANPGFRPVYKLRARIHVAQGNHARGLADLDSYLADEPSYDRLSWQAHGQRGRLLRFMYAELPQDQRRKPSAQALAALAVAELEKAVKLGGRVAEVFGDLGAMMEHTGQLKKAVRAYSNGLILAPKDVKLLNKRAWAYDQLGKRDLALEDFATAARVDPENGEAHSGLGYVRALQKRVPEAQREAHLALLHGSDKYIVLHNVACIYAALSQAEEGQAVDYQDVAMALLKQAVKLWKRAPTDLNEIELIAGEPTFEPLKGRRDFRDLLRDG